MEVALSYAKSSYIDSFSEMVNWLNEADRHGLVDQEVRNSILDVYEKNEPRREEKIARRFNSGEKLDERTIEIYMGYIDKKLS